MLSYERASERAYIFFFFWKFASLDLAGFCGNGEYIYSVYLICPETTNV